MGREHDIPGRRCAVVMIECPDCESSNTFIDDYRKSYIHGRGLDRIELRYRVPAYMCRHCGTKWITGEQEDALEKAVKTLVKVVLVDVADGEK